MTAPARVLPGQTIGFLGGGQLARMSALAARSMGYGVRILDPDRACAAAPIADEVIAASFDEPEAAAWLAARSAVVTFDVERIAPESAAAAARLAPVRPGPEVMALVQDRLVQKQWLASHGFPLGPFAPAGDAEEATRAAVALGRCRLKARRGGYDGRGQAAAPTPADAPEALRLLGGAPAVAEKELSLAAELSVLVARTASGEVAIHPPARNWAADGVLDVSVLPATLPPAVCERAMELAAAITRALEVVGLLAVELFLTEDGALLVNELAPRPHNTYHHADAACTTGQFEQLVRAVCGLPLGDPGLVRPAALANLLGGPALEAGRYPDALRMTGVRLHLYGKQPRPGRKVGHLVATADTPEQAVQRVKEARAVLLGVRT